MDTVEGAAADDRGAAAGLRPRTPRLSDAAAKHASMTSTEPFAAVDVIAAKRDGGRIPDEQIDWVIDAYTRGVVADEQMAALAMAILLNGMDARRAGPLDGGDDRLRRAAGPVRRVAGRPTDKHSTGGVGDKITLPLAPLVAACGAAVPQLSGRGLGPHRRHAGQAGVDPRLAGASCRNAEFLGAAATTSARWSARRATGWRRPTASCTRCATSPAPSSRSRSSRVRS